MSDALARVWKEQFGRTRPEKVLCVGLNYHDHAAEQGVEPPREPLFFGKFANAPLRPGRSDSSPEQDRPRGRRS